MVARLAGIVVAIVLAGCSAEGAPASVAPTETPTPTETSGPSPSREPLKLVWISDSTGIGVAEAYGKRIEADLGVPVEVTNGWTGNLSLRRLREIVEGAEGGVLETNGAGRINPADLIRGADVIVLSGTPYRAETPDHTWRPCAVDFEPDPSCVPDPVCGPETWTRFETELKALFDAVFKIRGGEPVILRTHDWYLPWGPVATWKLCDCVQACLECERQHNAAIHRAAATRGVPVAGYFAAFAGPNGDTPLPSGWTFDPVHLTPAGAEAMAGVMADLGYELVKPVGS